MAEKTKITFEQAIARLEVIVKSLDGGTSPLEESMTLYEEGVRIIKYCAALLDNAEQKVKILTAAPNGEMIEKPFAPLEGEKNG